jgi:hypothetical protein
VTRLFETKRNPHQERQSEPVGALKPSKAEKEKTGLKPAEIAPFFCALHNGTFGTVCGVPP